MLKVELRVVIGFGYINQHANRWAVLRAVFGLLGNMTLGRKYSNRF